MALQDTSGLDGHPRTAIPPILVVGAASRDLTEADPRGWRLGGAVSYAALTLARLRLPVRALIGVDDAAAGAHELDLLRDAGVDVAPARLARGPVFVNDERPEGRVQRCVEASDSLDPADLPLAWREPTAVFLGPVARELGSDWAAVPAAGAAVALGWQGLLRQLEAGKPVTRVAPAADPLVSRADLIGVSVDDVGTDQRLSGLVDLIRPGATLVVTRGAGGGSALTSHRPSRSTLHAYPAIASDGVVDPTGAGDVFLAALFGSLVSGNAVLGLDSAVPGSWSARLRFAAAAGSLAVEAPGLDGVPSLEAIRRRAAEVA